MKSIRVEILKPFEDYLPGQLVRVLTDNDGTPLTANWRRRLKDAKTDKCCKIVVKKQASTKSGDK